MNCTEGHHLRHCAVVDAVEVVGQNPFLLSRGCCHCQTSRYIFIGYNKRCKLDNMKHDYVVGLICLLKMILKYN